MLRRKFSRFCVLFIGLRRAVRYWTILVMRMLLKYIDICLPSSMLLSWRIIPILFAQNLPYFDNFLKRIFFTWNLREIPLYGIWTNTYSLFCLLFQLILLGYQITWSISTTSSQSLTLSTLSGLFHPLYWVDLSRL